MKSARNWLILLSTLISACAHGPQVSEYVWDCEKTYKLEDCKMVGTSPTGQELTLTPYEANNMICETPRDKERVLRWKKK